MSKFKIAAVQMDVVLAEPGRNRERIAERLTKAAAEGAQLVVFPECAITGYCFESLKEAQPLAETIPGESTQLIGQTCRQLGVWAVFGLLETAADGGVFNACVLVGPAGEMASYRKVHLPKLGVDWFATPGDRPFAVHQAGPLRVGMNICYDLAFPEASRALALAGADLIVLPTNWPPGAEETAQSLPNARALENRVYYLAANRVGTERDVQFLGQSKICDTEGRVLAHADHTRETILYAEIDPERPRDKHIVRVAGKHEIDRFADRRPEYYGPISKE